MKSRVFLILLLLPFPLFPAEEGKILHNYLPIQRADLILIPDLPEANAAEVYYRENKPSYAVEMLYEFPGKILIDWEELYNKLHGADLPLKFPKYLRE